MRKYKDWSGRTHVSLPPPRDKEPTPQERRYANYSDAQARRDEARQLGHES